MLCLPITFVFLFWKDVETWSPLGIVPVEFDRPEYESSHSVIVNIARPAFGEINEEFFDSIGQNYFLCYNRISYCSSSLDNDV